MRSKLPTRRCSITHDVDFRGSRFSVTVGYDRAGVVKEVFADSDNGGSAFAEVVRDACVLVSLLLQHGAVPREILNSLGREPDPMRGEDATRPASPIGLIVDVVEIPLARVLAGLEGAA